jgi:hypothetical protein
MARSRDVDFPSLDDFKPATLRGSRGFFRVGQTKHGQWWFLDAHDRAIFSKAVAAVSRTGWAEGRSSKPGVYTETVNALYGVGEPDRFVRSVVQRMRDWRLNTLGAWTSPEFYDQGVYYTELIEFRKVGPSFHYGGALLPDVFDPAWRDAADAWAKQICQPRKDSTELVGYFTDHELEWAQPVADLGPAAADRESKKERPALLQLCLSLEPTYRAYHAAWEFVLAHRQGELERLSKEWGLALQSREVVRQMTHAEQPIKGEAFQRDQRRFTREFARRYFSTCSSVIRAYDPNHLILGCRFGEFPGGVVLSEAIHGNVDVVSIKPQREHWERTAQACFSANGMPVLLTELSWADPVFARTPIKRETRRLTSVERMLAKGRVGLEKVFGHRAIVGYEWARWVDSDSDEPPFGGGLVHVNDREATEHTELLTDLNARAEILRARV